MGGRRRKIQGNLEPLFFHRYLDRQPLIRPRRARRPVRRGPVRGRDPVVFLVSAMDRHDRPS